MQSRRQDRDQNVFGEEDSDDAGDRSQCKKPCRDEYRNRCQDNLPQSKVNPSQRTFIANCRRRQRRENGSHDSIIARANLVANLFRSQDVTPGYQAFPDSPRARRIREISAATAKALCKITRC
jgi:hypothetical protein